MASTPPLQVEDQTDEDFFDKLVNDEYGPPEAASSSATDIKFGDGNDSDDARAFANLSIGEDSGTEDQLHEEKKTGNDDSADAVAAGSLSAELSLDKDNDHSLGVMKAFEFDSIGPNDSRNGEPGSKVEDVSVSDSAGGCKNDGSGSFGVKEVGWSSFYADSSENGGHGFGSYSDFFSGLEENANDFQGKVEENINGGGRIVSGGEYNRASGLDNSFGYGQYHDGQVYSSSVDQGANGQDLNSSQYWENQYPGWKYDPNTGQWYPVDGYNANLNAQGSYDNAATDQIGVSDGKSEVAYFRQSTQTGVGTIAETGTIESVSSWNQASQPNNGYPEHMVFDPQYPDWYYDMIAQEWRSLQSYDAAAQSSVQSNDQQIQDGYASSGAYASDNSGSVYGDHGQAHRQSLQDLGNQIQHDGWNQSYGDYNKQGVNMWQPETAAKTEAAASFGGSQQAGGFFGVEGSVNNNVGRQPSTFQSFGKMTQGHFDANGVTGVQGFVPGANLSQQFNAVIEEQNGQMSFTNDFYSSPKSENVAQQSFQSSQQFPYAPSVGRSSDGRPPHTLVTFGFGGKLIVIKDNSSSLQNSSFGSQNAVGSSISVLNLMEVATGKANAFDFGGDTSGYFHTLCQQSLPGPLVGGSVGSKDLNKWLDERITNCELPDVDFLKGQRLRLLLSLLKISCQHYGKLRSPFGVDTALKEADTPEAAIAKLFASAKNSMQSGAYGALRGCLHNIPPDAQMRATASEVQNLLVSGRKLEALQCAQEGQLWGPALVIATQLGKQFYVDTVKQMALHQLVAGSPLRTLCLLISGQPAEVFFTGDSSDSGLPGSVNMSQHQSQIQVGTKSMLDDWEQNLAVMAANRTKDDELVITHLGDCLWKERGDIIAAHICYLIAEKNFEPYSDTARICLAGADHWRFPRTFASPEAIQMTEVYEYSKVLGNSQYILLPFQPYKLIYAHMLAEVGKVSDALKYCQAVLKLLKPGRAPEVETWKQLVLSLEERIRIHQQGGYTATLAPAKLVGKLFNFIDSTAHRVVGGLPPPAPSTSLGNIQVNEYLHQQALPIAPPRPSNSQPSMAMASLIPSASMEPIREWAGDGSRMTVHNRSVSEPNFGIRPRQENQVVSSKEKTVDGAQDKASDSGNASRFSRFSFGSQLFKKTVGLVLRPRPSREAKLGEKNKFYYDEKLKRWVEEGAEPPAEEAALPPPPTTAALQNNFSDYGNKSDMKTEMSPAGGNPNFGGPTPSENSSGIPPLPSSSNQFSARARMGVRARYVDTFNQGHGNKASANMFKSPSVPALKPTTAPNAKFFIPTPLPTDGQGMGAIAESVQENPANENASVSTISEPFQTAASSPMNVQRFPSMDNIKRAESATNVTGAHPPTHSRRTASWSGSFNNPFTPPEKTEGKPLGEAPAMSSTAFMPSPLKSSGSFGDELHEVEL